MMDLYLEERRLAVSLTPPLETALGAVLVWRRAPRDDHSADQALERTLTVLPTKEVAWALTLLHKYRELTPQLAQTVDALQTENDRLRREAEESASLLASYRALEERITFAMERLRVALGDPNLTTIEDHVDAVARRLR